MLRDIDWPKNLTYKAKRKYVPQEFYLSALENAKDFDLLLGYFSTTAIRRLSLGFATFINNGGTLRLVINHILSEKDRDAIQAGFEGNVDSHLINITDPVWLKNTLNEYGEHFFECISWLIQNDRIKIKLIRPKYGDGIAHYKQGVISDGIDRVSFYGSCNFTEYGLVENLESLRVTLDWNNELSSEQVLSDVEYFNDIFNELDDEIEYLTIDDVVINIRDGFKGKTAEELLIREEELTLHTLRSEENERLKVITSRLSDKIESYGREPRFPFPEGPRQYQKEAYQNWLANDRSGIFAMATGTGKTITSLNCVLNEYQREPEAKVNAIILVPTITLVDQWENESRRFNFRNIYKISSDTDWERAVFTSVSSYKRTKEPFILIATYATFVKDKFQSLLHQVPQNTILIADEAHNIGSENVLKIVTDLQLKMRIALSATPKRNYDIDGTEKIELIFNDKEPYTYSFSMERAIKEDVLCQYNYYPLIVELTSDEMVEYKEISIKISSLNKRDNDTKSEDILKRLLLKRKRIIHKAKNKLSKTVDILKAIYEEKKSLKYTFLYVPEGFVDDQDDSTIENESIEVRLINQYIREIAKIDDTLMINQFVSNMKDRDEILRQFENGKIDIIASMRCLDEGIDVPRAETAIFCSSTGNPRQFIQRRGRILRKHPLKHNANIYDLVVVPEPNDSGITGDTYIMEKNLVRKELERVMHFASLAKNPFYTEEVFKNICKKYELNINDILLELSTV